jgi:hypothetical protein
MPDVTQTVKEFVTDAYSLVNPSSPTVPLHGNDMSKGVQWLNELLSFYSATGLRLTISKKIQFPMTIGQQFVTFGSATYTPTPDVISGRLANAENVWLNLQGVTYPLKIENRNVFFDSYKYFPQQGLPRFAIIVNDTNLTTMQVYPSPSQVYDLFVFGKFELPVLTENDTMAGLPNYYLRFFKLALAKDIAGYKGRANAWTPFLENKLVEATQDMESVSSVNVLIDSDHDSYLNGAWRVRAGI